MAGTLWRNCNFSQTHTLPAAFESLRHKSKWKSSLLVPCRSAVIVSLSGSLGRGNVSRSFPRGFLFKMCRLRRRETPDFIGPKGTSRVKASRRSDAVLLVENLIWWVVEGGYRLWNDFLFFFKTLLSIPRLPAGQDEKNRSSAVRKVKAAMRRELFNDQISAAGIPLHHPQKIKSSTTWKMLSLTLSQRQDCEHVCFCSLEPGKTLEKKSHLYSLNEGTHSHTFFPPPPHLCGFFFSSFRANKHIPTSNNSKYLCSVSSIQTFMLAWKTNSNSNI